MSPEIFKNKPYSYKSDVWALGCVLYEMATLNHAFDANSLNGLASKIVKGKYPPINSKYSKNLRDLIAHMLQINASQRPDVEQILRMPFIKKHVVNFFIDIVTRPTQSIGEGTMIFRAAAVGGGGSESIMNDTNMLSLREQLKQLDMMDSVHQALAPKSQPKNDEEALNLAREQASALKREQEKKKYLEDALLKLQKEKSNIRNPLSRIPPSKSRVGGSNLHSNPSRSNLNPSPSNANRPGWNRNPSHANLNLHQKRQSEERERLERERAAREAAEAERVERERRYKENQNRIMEQESQRRKEEISRAREIEKEKLRIAELEKFRMYEKGKREREIEREREKELEREKLQNASDQARARRELIRAKEVEKQRLEIEQLKQDKLILDRRQMEKDKKREERKNSELSRIQIDRQNNLDKVREKLDDMNKQISKLEISPSASRLERAQEESYSYNRYNRAEANVHSKPSNAYSEKQFSSDSGSEDDNIFSNNDEHNLEEEEEDLNSKENQLREELMMTTRRVEELQDNLTKTKSYLPKDAPLMKKKVQEDYRNERKSQEYEDYDEDEDDDYYEDEFDSDNEEDSNLDVTHRNVQAQNHLSYESSNQNPGKLCDRIKSVRNKCILGLGLNTFNEAYNLLCNNDYDDNNHLKKKELSPILGEDKIEYLELLEQLIFMEKFN